MINIKHQFVCFFDKKYILTAFVITISTMNFASLVRSSQAVARSLSRSVAHQNILHNDFSFMPKAPDFITVEKNLEWQPQVGLISDQHDEATWEMSSQQEQDTNNSIRAYAKQQSQLAEKRELEEKKHSDRMHLLEHQRAIIEQKTDQIFEEEHLEFERAKLKREQMQGVATYFGLPIMSLLFIIGLLAE